MAEHSRIDDLRRRVQQDPASIAFAQLAEECRRAGEYQEAVDICRAGLEIHPGYLSARVTLGRALLELDRLEEAHAELSRVIEGASENLAAIRGLAEIHHRRGDLAEALAHYRAALAIARNDPDLEETVADLSRQIEPPKPPATGGLILEHMQDELQKHAQKGDGSHFPAADSDPESSENPAIEGQVSAGPTPVPFLPPAVPAASEMIPVPFFSTLAAAADDRAARTVAELEQWLDAIHVSRAHRHS